LIRDAGGHDAKLLIGGAGKSAAHYIEQLVQATRVPDRRLEFLNDRR
jgi:hypothetical protein